MADCSVCIRGGLEICGSCCGARCILGYVRWQHSRNTHELAGAAVSDMSLDSFYNYIVGHLK